MFISPTRYLAISKLMIIITRPITFLLLDECQKQSATHQVLNHPSGLHFSLAVAAVIREIARAFDEQTQNLGENCITKDS